MSHTFILAPFIVAFLGFILRFYGRENAASKSNPSFLLAAATVIIAVTFLALGVMDLLPAYSTVAFGGVGLALAILAGVRMFMI
jgi:hypothetical protein